MAKGQNTQAKVSGETSDKLYYGENNQCLNFLNAGLGLIALALVIPWSIWAFTSSLWPTSEAFNADTMTWVKVAILALVSFLLYQIMVKMSAAHMSCGYMSNELSEFIILFFNHIIVLTIINHISSSFLLFKYSSDVLWRYVAKVQAKT